MEENVEGRREYLTRRGNGKLCISIRVRACKCVDGKAGRGRRGQVKEVVTWSGGNLPCESHSWMGIKRGVIS